VAIPRKKYKEIIRREVEAPVGRYRGSMEVVDLSLLEKAFEKAKAKPSLLSPRERVKSLEAEVEVEELRTRKAEAEARRVEAEARLQDALRRHRGGHECPECTIVTLNPHNPGEAKEHKVKPGGSVVVVTPEGGVGEKRPEVALSGDTLLKLVTEKGGGGITLSDLAKYVDAKLEGAVAKVEGRLREELRNIHDDIKKLAERKPSEKPGKSDLDTFFNRLEKLEKLGLIKFTKKEETPRETGELTGKDKVSYFIAKDKLDLEKKKLELDRKYKMEKLKILKDFSRDIGEAIAEAMMEEEGGGEKESGARRIKGGGRRRKRKKTALETLRCEVCGSSIPIPPEKQRAGETITCSKCGSKYEYEEEREEE